MTGTSGAKNILLVQWFLIDSVRCCSYPRSPDHSTSRAKNILLVQWFLINPVRRCGYPGGLVTSTSRARNILLVQWFLIRWRTRLLRGYVGSVLELEGLG